MKFIAAPLLAALAAPAWAVDVGHLRVHATQAAQAGDAVAAEATARATPQDLDECLRVASRFIHGPKAIKLVKELAVDFCAKSKSPEERGIVCPPFIHSLHRVLDSQPDDGIVTAEGFCAIAEARMLETRGATRVSNVGSGPLMNFTISESCPKMLEAQMGTTHLVSQEHAPDMWYIACMSQDCGHHLPSRTKWCNQNHPPTHSMWICESARSFVKEQTKLGGKPLSGADMCGLYSDFVKELSVDVEAYEHIMHADTVKRVPVPNQADLALRSTQLVNDAGARDLRAGAGDPVLPPMHTHRSAGAGSQVAKTVLSMAFVLALFRL